jgi:soluble lytic murein transglycosylase-like protein
MSYIFGGNTGMTLEQVQRQRKIAEQMAFGGPQARNVGEGIGKIGNAIAGVIMARRASRSEEAGRKGVNDAFAALMAPNPPAAASFAPSPAPVPSAPIETFTPQNLTARQIQAESGGDPNAVSPKGATGLMQVMPATARDPGFGVPNIFDMARSMGRDVPRDDPVTLQTLLRDPEVNVAFGEAYRDAMMREQGGDPRLGLAAYNAGPGAVASAGGIPNFPETQNYVNTLAPQGQPQGGAAPPAMGGAPMGGQPAMRSPAGATGPDQSRINQIAELIGSGFASPGQQAVLERELQQEMAKGDPREALKMRMLQAQVRTAERGPQADATSAMREFEYAQRNGFGGSFFDWRKAGSPGTNITVEGAQAPDPIATANAAGIETMMKKFGTTMGESAANGGKYAQQLGQLDQLEGLLSQAGTGTAQAWGQWATDRLGIQITGGPSQAASALINQIIPAQRPEGSGEMSDGDVRMFRASVPSLVNKPGGNAEILFGMRAIAEHNYAISQIAGKYGPAGLETKGAVMAEFRKADQALSDKLKARREAKPEMYGKVQSAESIRAELARGGAK